MSKCHSQPTPPTQFTHCVASNVIPFVVFCFINTELNSNPTYSSYVGLFLGLLSSHPLSLYIYIYTRTQILFSNHTSMLCKFLSYFDLYIPFLCSWQFQLCTCICINMTRRGDASCITLQGFIQHAPLKGRQSKLWGLLCRVNSALVFLHFLQSLVVCHK